MLALQAIFLLLSAAGFAQYLLAIYAGWRFFKDEAQPSNTNAPSPLPPVSILKPISGADEDTYENLASFCQQHYPAYEVLFGVQTSADASIPVIEKLARDFPQADVRYAICQRAVGTNNKINNLAQAFKLAKHDIIVTSDSDVRVGQDYLRNITQPFSHPATAAVTCPYRSRAKGWVASFETLAVATEAFPIDLLSRFLEGMTFAMGPTIAVRRSALASIGGFEAIADYLHDDYQLGHTLFRAGHKIVLSHYVVDHVVGAETWSDFVQRQMRWTRGTRCARPWGYFGLIFTFATVWSLLFMLATGSSTLGVVVFMAVLAVRYTMAWLIGVRYLRDEVAARCLPWVPIRDIMSFVFWLQGFFGDTVVWRGQRMRVLPDGKLALLYNQPHPLLTKD